MYRLLIVDNEPLIVEGLAHLMEDAPSLALEIYRAFSAAEALDWMNRTKMDIALLDIRMPGMNGLELQREMIKQWPRCKIIFLTGFDDFTYIQEAIRNNSVDYLLKTDGDESIVRAVEKAVTEIQKEWDVDSVIAQAKQQLRLAAPVLQKELLWEVMQGEAGSLDHLNNQFSELDLDLDAEMPVMLVIGAVTQWNQSYRPADRSLLMYAVGNIANELLSESAKCHCFVHDRHHLICLIQSDELKWDRTARFVLGTLEQLQDNCERLLKLSISLAAASEGVEWSGVPEQFEALTLQMSRGVLEDDKRLLVLKKETDAAKRKNSQDEHTVRVAVNRIDDLRMMLEAGRKEDFFGQYQLLMSTISYYSDGIGHYRLEAYYRFSALFTSCMNQWGVQRQSGLETEWSRLQTLNPLSDWAEVCRCFQTFGERLFEIKREGERDETEKTISVLQRYVESHLADDLSLTRLGEVVGYNPSYLSRYYKQYTGQGLSDYIVEVRLKKAKEMLGDKHVKISAIAPALGFLSEPYLYRFFKKQTGLTPQEYRDGVIEK
ncbi:response regulator [Paenibacillus sp. HB172176]|uniref:response regulator transcription factor n=1 Tax=Paenibacillus sp. HB172176 TaxID=2493690 RepID=UPI00143B75A1|nr:response regulator [Paenibacillus sp. HB172176]